MPAFSPFESRQGLPVGGLGPEQLEVAKQLDEVLWSALAAPKQKEAHKKRQDEQRERLVRRRARALKGRGRKDAPKEPHPPKRESGFLFEVAKAFLEGRFRPCQIAAIRHVLNILRSSHAHGAQQALATALGLWRQQVNDAASGKRLLSAPTWSFLVNLYASQLGSLQEPSLSARRRSAFIRAIVRVNRLLPPPPPKQKEPAATNPAASSHSAPSEEGSGSSVGVSPSTATSGARRKADEEQATRTLEEGWGARSHDEGFGVPAEVPEELREPVKAIHFAILCCAFAPKGAGVHPRKSVVFPQIDELRAKALLKELRRRPNDKMAMDALQKETGATNLTAAMNAANLYSAADLQACARALVIDYGPAFLFACHALRLSWRLEATPAF